MGTLKPSPVPFMAIAQRAGIPPSRILFIGNARYHSLDSTNPFCYFYLMLRVFIFEAENRSNMHQGPRACECIIGVYLNPFLLYVPISIGSHSACLFACLFVCLFV